MPALQTAITDPNGFQEGCSSEPAAGITAQIAFTGTSIMGWMYARATTDRFRDEGSGLPNNAGSSTAKRCMIPAAAKLRAGGKRLRDLPR